MAPKISNQQIIQLLGLLPNVGGTVAVIYCVDNNLVRETIEHHLKLNFDAVLVVGSELNFEYEHERVVNVSVTIDHYDQIWNHMRGLMSKLTGHWIYWGYNAEFLYYPFCETRTIRDLAIFLTEERRQTLFGMTIDLYAMELKKVGTGYDLKKSGFDAINYFSKPLDPAPFNKLANYDETRMKEIKGGLKWRFSEWFGGKASTINRVPFFLVTDKLEFDDKGQSDDPEFYSFRCVHHHNPTAAVMSYRTVIDLRHNPASRQQIGKFSWVGTETFNWNSPQLLRLGIIETGQWF